MIIPSESTLLFLDTETTGFKNTRMCQIALVLTDAQGKIKSQFSSLVKPDGWNISEGAYNCHGITDEECERHGWPISVVMGACYWFMLKSDIIVAHNTSHDKRVLQIEERHNKDLQRERLIEFNKWYCTQENSKNLCKIPPTDRMIRAKRTGYKSPKLEEALYILTGRRMKNAHDAMEDTIACKDVFFAVQQSVAQHSGACYNYNVGENK